MSKAENLRTVPTIRELIKMGSQFGWATHWDAEGNPTRFHLTTHGHAYLGAIMAENAAARIAAGEGDWVQPPSRVDLVEALSASVTPQNDPGRASTATEGVSGAPGRVPAQPHDIPPEGGYVDVRKRCECEQDGNPGEHHFTWCSRYTQGGSR